MIDALIDAIGSFMEAVVDALTKVMDRLTKLIARGVDWLFGRVYKKDEIALERGGYIHLHYVQLKPSIA